MKITRWCGTADLIVRTYSLALANSGRTFTRVLIFSEEIGSHPAAARAALQRVI
ncbi:hypothetical protein AB0C33_14835 [Nonomuraea sp. NPDC048881]|uniref:hypothetical protein n=1 Tax=Nonomuraea sp. NPDC048881 TaxID=3155030 RepID=UPI0033C489E4